MEKTNARIAELFEESGLTIRDLAEAADCSKSALQRYISGDRSVPSPIVERLAKAFNVHPAYVFGWTDDRHFTINNEEKPADYDELSPTQKLLVDTVMRMSDAEAKKFEALLRLVRDED